MKILILSRDFRQLGGVVNFVGNLKKCLGTEMVAEDFRIGARIGKSSRIGKLLCPLWDSVRLARLVTRGQYDVIHLNPSLDARAVLREGLFLLTLILLGKANRTFVLFHGWSTEVEQGVRGHQALRALFVAVFGRAAVVGVLGSIFRKSLRDIGLKESRVKVLTTMFDGKELLGVQRDRAWEGRTVLFLSRFAREKGAYELLQAFREVSKRVPDVRLVLAGDGPERANLEQWVGDHELAARVVFTGYVRGREKARTLVNADIFVLPTYHGEGCPVALLEAMGAGLAVVASGVGGIPDVLADGANGIILEDTRPETIAREIIRLLEDSKLLRRLQEDARQRAWQQFEAEAVTRRVKQVYWQIAASGARAEI